MGPVLVTMAATMAACPSLQPMDELTRVRWQLIAGEVVDRVFAEAGVDEFLEADRVPADMAGEVRAALDQAC